MTTPATPPEPGNDDQSVPPSDADHDEHPAPLPEPDHDEDPAPDAPSAVDEGSDSAAPTPPGWGDPPPPPRDGEPPSSADPQPPPSAPGSGATPPPPAPSGPTPPPPPSGRPHRRLDRRSRDRVIAGVAGGLGDYFNIDPAIFRLAFVALMFFGGAGVPLYGLAWLLLPERDTGRSIADGLVDRFSSGNKPAGRVILALIALIVVINIGGEWLWAALLIGLGVLLFRKDTDGDARRDDGGTGPAPARRTDTTPASEQSNAAPASPPVTAPPTTGTERPERSTAGVPEPLSEARSSNPYDDAYYADILTAPPPSPTDDGWRPTPLSSPPQPPPPPSILGRLTVAAVLIVIGVVALLDTLTGLDVTPARYAALALTIVGAGLLIGARWGRARGLIALGAVTLIVLVGLAVSAAAPFRLPTASSDPLIYTPATVAELTAGDYDLGFGELRIDLTQLDLNPGQQVALDASVGFGSLEVIVPDDVALTGQAEARMGDINVLGDTRDGAPATMIVNEPGGEGSPTIALDLRAGFGEIDVRETAVQSPDGQRPGLQPAEEGI